MKPLIKEKIRSVSVTEKLTKMKSGIELRGVSRSTGGRGSIVRWPLCPVNPIRKDSSFAATNRSITLLMLFPRFFSVLILLQAQNKCVSIQISPAMLRRKNSEQGKKNCRLPWFWRYSPAIGHGGMFIYIIFS